MPIIAIYFMFLPQLKPYGITDNQTYPLFIKEQVWFWVFHYAQRSHGYIGFYRNVLLQIIDVAYVKSHP